jgi:hypothetical protein
VNWLDVKREVTDAIGSVDRLRGRARHYSARKVTPPAYFIDLPDGMTLHAAGDMSRWVVPFSVVVGAVDAESSEIELSEFIDESGPRSVVRAVEDHLYVACSVVTVTGIEPVAMTIGGVQYLGALFSSDIAGKGR